MFSCNVRAENCTGISQGPVNSNKRSFGWHSTVRKTSLVISYGMNCITVTKTVHINHIRIRETENLNGILKVKDTGRQEQLLNDTCCTNTCMSPVRLSTPRHVRCNTCMSLVRLSTPPPPFKNLPS